MSSTHILRSAEGNTGDARNPLEAKGEESLPRLALRAGLDLVECRLGGGVLFMSVVVVVVVVVAVVVTLVVGVVRVNLLDGSRHLCS